MFGWTGGLMFASPRPSPARRQSGVRPVLPFPAGARTLVTGASSGIGAATAAALGEFGARLFLTGRDGPTLARIAAAIPGPFLPIDLTSPGAPETVVEAAVGALGGLDVVVSSAGIGWAGAFATMTPDQLDRLLDINVRVPGRLALAALPYLRRGHGRLVLVGSIAGLLGAPGETWYSTTKAAVTGLADGLRRELKPVGVGVTLVSPGVVDTAFFARRNVPYERRFPHPIQPPEVAAGIVAALRDGRDEVIVPSWLHLPVGLKVGLPRLYRLLASHFSG